MSARAEQTDQGPDQESSLGICLWQTFYHVCPLSIESEPLFNSLSRDFYNRVGWWRHDLRDLPERWRILPVSGWQTGRYQPLLRLRWLAREHRERPQREWVLFIHEICSFLCFFSWNFHFIHEISSIFNVVFIHYILSFLHQLFSQNFDFFHEIST